MRETLQAILVALFFAGSSHGRAQSTNTADHDVTTGFFLSIEFVGPVTRSWYGVALASPGEQHRARDWRQKHSINVNYALIGVLSAEELRRIRHYLTTPSIAAKRIARFPGEPSQYIITVIEAGETLFIPIGFSSDTLQSLRSLASLLDGENAGSLAKVTGRIAFLDKRPQEDTKQ